MQMGVLDFHLDDGGLVFAQLPLSDHHLPPADVSGAFLKAFDHTGDIDNPTSSPSDSDGSSARASEATPAAADLQQWTSVSHSGSWAMAPQLLSVHTDGAAVPAPVLYGTSVQPQAQWGAPAQAAWRPAFQASTTQQQTSKGTIWSCDSLRALASRSDSAL